MTDRHFKRTLFVTTGKSIRTGATCWKDSRAAWSETDRGSRRGKDADLGEAVDFDPEAWTADPDQYPGLDLGGELATLKRYHALSPIGGDDRIVLIHDDGNEAESALLSEILAGPALAEALGGRSPDVRRERLHRSKGRDWVTATAEAIDELGDRMEQWRRGANRNVYFVGPGTTPLIIAMHLFAQYASEGSQVEMYYAAQGDAGLLPLPVHPGDTFLSFAERLGS